MYDYIILTEKGHFRPPQRRNPLADMDHTWHVLHTAGHPPCKVWFWSDDVGGLGE